MTVKHPTAKPLDLALDLVSWFSLPGRSVLDLTCGRGVIGVACALLGRNFTGFELTPSEAVLAAARCATAERFKLNERDRDRFDRWTSGVPAVAPPWSGKKEELRTWERLCRRIKDRNDALERIAA